MKIHLLLLLFLFLSFPSQAQHTLSGRVIDEASGEPLEFVSVYINTTTRGTATDEHGKFSLTLSAGKFELIVTYLGYEPIIYSLDTRLPLPDLLFKMSKKVIGLQESVVLGKRDEEWYINLEVFKQNFLGRSALGGQCRLLNPEVLTIVFDPNTGILDVASDELLQIENQALGYKIEYLLEEFKLYTRGGYCYFMGYPRYIPLEGGRSKQKRWAKKRAVAYNGSAMHFIRALRAKKLEEQGFNLRRLYRMPNPNRPSENEIAAARELSRLAGGPAYVHDSVRSVLQRAGLPKHIEQLDARKVPYQEYLQVSQDSVLLRFRDYLQIVYTGEKEEQVYVYLQHPFRKRHPMYQTSVISLQSAFVLVEENGTVSPPLDLLLEGYWGFEKIGDMLPLDYSLIP
ncbi:carboxypeptidase-like regulatory domain-containing protein [Pontibacter sp. Tf4]|uniref:carboxypeptidase-like regulatory domain-containing protein n=1 Tax=Pontibacter sp. Tf4 TaxID=2761620 RepID=UPI0016269BAE|nr:carboxypeptidase-like regulatory domain-containing protein [Pontibacter sp. Tf4]MBB6611759.1 carboxypeptidase-like regulatory domain-containing protein [Pontibacter sp. Tf4]